MTRSQINGVKWVVSNDEQSPQQDGVVPDSVDSTHDVIRKQVLWGNIMYGGGGVEYYFGYAHTNSDLTCEDYRSRQNMWSMTRNALTFFTNHAVPFWNMTQADEIVSDRTMNSCRATSDLSDIVVYLRNGGEEMINLSSFPSDVVYSIRWYDPMIGGNLFNGTKSSTVAGSAQPIGRAPYKAFDKDWIVLLRRIK